MWGPGAAWLPAAVLTRDREPGTRTRLGKGVRTRPHPRPPHTDDSERARHSPSGNDPRPALGLSAGRAASGRKSSVLSVSHWSPATPTPAQGRSEAAQKAARLLFSSSRKCLSSGEKCVGRGGVRGCEAARKTAAHSGNAEREPRRSPRRPHLRRKGRPGPRAGGGGSCSSGDCPQRTHAAPAPSGDAAGAPYLSCLRALMST